jgi:hypothetical protein
MEVNVKGLPKKMPVIVEAAQNVGAAAVPAD